MATSPNLDAGAAPVRHMSWTDAVAVVVGIVLGAFVFKSPGMVAGMTGDTTWMMLTWVFGGLLCLCGALTYAELATAYPHSGGEYVYISTSFGRPIGFLFVWARVAVIQTGSIAALAYVFGDYVVKILPSLPLSPLGWALLATAVLTILNAVGLKTGKVTQNILTLTKVLGVLAIMAAGLLFAPEQPAAAAAASSDVEGGGISFAGFGLAMVFVLLTYGGWNEAAYVAGEVRDARRNMLRVLLVSIFALMALYLLITLSYWRVLGLEGMAKADAVAADAMSRVAGPTGGILVSILVAISALGAMNGCIFTGARAMWALGNDFHILRPLARWHTRFKTPFNAMLIQGAVTLVLILLPGSSETFRAVFGSAFGSADWYVKIDGALAWFCGRLGSGFESTASYTAPAFWMFMYLVSLAVFVLRGREKSIAEQFRAPFYPLTAVLFSLMCAYMMYSSLAYTKYGALVGVGVLIVGVPLYFIFCRKGGNESPATGPAEVGGPESSKD
jgi:amino acid transporter